MKAAAEDGASAVLVDYEPLEALIDPLQALDPATRAVWESGLPGETPRPACTRRSRQPNRKLPQARNVSSTTTFAGGDLERGFAEADVVVERTYRTSVVHQSYLEPHATVAALDPLGNLTVWTSTQAMLYARDEVAAVLGLPTAKVKVVPMPVGGGFGGKVVCSSPSRPLFRYCSSDQSGWCTPEWTSSPAVRPRPGRSWSSRWAPVRGKLTAIDSRIIFDAGLFPGTPRRSGDRDRGQLPGRALSHPTL